MCLNSLASLSKAGPFLFSVKSQQFCLDVVVVFRHSFMSGSLWPHGLQHARFPCPSLSPGVCSNSYLLSWWCHPTISSSVTPFSSCPQSFPASGPFPMSWLFPKYWSFSFSISPSSDYSGLISYSSLSHILVLHFCPFQLHHFTHVSFVSLHCKPLECRDNVLSFCFISLISWNTAWSTIGWAKLLNWVELCAKG